MKTFITPDKLPSHGLSRFGHQQFNALMFAKVFGLRGYAEPVKVNRRSNDAHLGVTQAPRNQPGVSHFADPHCDIEALRNEVGNRVGQARHDLELTLIRGDKARQAGDQVHDTVTGWQADS